jgi:histidine triad (HIT) family protein
MNDCLFCKIIGGDIPAEKVFGDEECIAFKDINPQTRVHLLIVPRKHIPTIAEMEDSDEPIMGHLIGVAKKLAAENECPGYKLQFNVGKAGGQEVFHIHMHLMGS